MLMLCGVSPRQPGRGDEARRDGQVSSGGHEDLSIRAGRGAPQGAAPLTAAAWLDVRGIGRRVATSAGCRAGGKSRRRDRVM
jgi:hypothetical protein